MSLEYKVDSLDAVDESLKGLYEQGENGFTLKVNGLEDTSGLKSALVKERDLNKSNKTRLKELEDAKIAAETMTMEEKGKFKELYESQQTKTLESQKDYSTLQARIAQANGNSIVKDLALSMTTNVNEIEIISRFASDMLTYEGEEAKFNKPLEEIKTGLSRFVLSKAGGGNDRGNNNNSGNKDPQQMSESERLKLYRENPTEFNRLFKGK